MSSQTNALPVRLPVEVLTKAFLSRLQYRQNDDKASDLAQELMDEVENSMGLGEIGHLRGIIAAGEMAAYFLTEVFTLNGQRLEPFVETRKVLWKAAVSAWLGTTEELPGVTQERYFARFIAQAPKNWHVDERKMAIHHLSERLRKHDTSFFLPKVRRALAISEITDDEEVLATLGRTLGHISTAGSLKLMATIADAQPQELNRLPQDIAEEVITIALPAMFRRCPRLLEIAAIAQRLKYDCGGNPLPEVSIRREEITLTSVIYEKPQAGGDGSITERNESEMELLLEARAKAILTLVEKLPKAAGVVIKLVYISLAPANNEKLGTWSKEIKTEKPKREEP